MNPPKVQTGAHLKEPTGIDNPPPANMKWVSKQGRFRTLLLAASKDPSDASAAKNYLGAGVAVADLYCRAYFERLGEQRADQEALQGSVNITNGVTSAALGLAEASADTISLVSVSFSAIEALFGTLDAAYLVSPDIEQVEALVFSARDTLHSKIFADTSTITYFEAERRLAAYHQLCTFNGVTRLVNEAVASGKPILQTSQTTGRERLFRTAAVPVLQSLSALLGNSGSSLSEDDAKYLFAYYAGFSENDGISASVLKKVGDSLKGSDVQKKLATLNENKLSAVSILSQLDEMLGLTEPATEWSNSVRAKTQRIKELIEKLNPDPAANTPDHQDKAYICNNSGAAAAPPSEFMLAFSALSELTSEDDAKSAARCASPHAVNGPAQKTSAEIAAASANLASSNQPPILLAPGEKLDCTLTVRIE